MVVSKRDIYILMKKSPGPENTRFSGPIKYSIIFNNFERGGCTGGYHILPVLRQQYCIRHCTTSVCYLPASNLHQSQVMPSVAFLHLLKVLAIENESWQQIPLAQSLKMSQSEISQLYILSHN